MHRRVKKVERALSLKNRKKVSLSEEIPLPRPQFEFEDTLVSQLRASDVLSNCYDEYVVTQDGEFRIDQSPKRSVIRKHPFHFDGNLMPVWQAYYSLDKRASGSVLLGRLMTLTTLIGDLLNPRNLTEKSIHARFIGTSHVPFNEFKSFIERAVSQNILSSIIDWKRVRAVCWSQCESWHLQSIPFDLPGNGDMTQDLYHSLYWLWCTFNQVAETDTYPPSADYEEIELLLRKLFSSLGILWEDFDDNASSSSSSISSHNVQNGHAGRGSLKSADGLGSSLTRLLEDDNTTDDEENGPATAETLLVTFQQLLSILSDMLGTDTVLSPSFNRAVTQVYLSEVEEIVKTGWMYLKKPGTDTWRKRWTVLRRQCLEFYSDQLCDPMKYQIVLNNRMHIESLPALSSHKHRFRLVEREGDFNIAWEAEMSCMDSQHAHSWMLVINLSIKINPTGLSAKRVELAERKLERHRRRESEFSAIEKRREAKKTRKKLDDVKERWAVMQDKLQERAAARERAMVTVQKMDEIYDKLQSVTKKQSLIRKTNFRIRSAFPSMSSDSGVEMTKDERDLLKTRDEKLQEQEEKMEKLEEEKRALQQQLVELQASAILSDDTDKTLILVYGPENDLDNERNPLSKARANSLAPAHYPSRHFAKKRTNTYNSPYVSRKNGHVPAISISTSALAGSPSSISSLSSLKLSTAHSQSHPELHNGQNGGNLNSNRHDSNLTDSPRSLKSGVGHDSDQIDVTLTCSSVDSEGSSVASREKLV